MLTNCNWAHEKSVFCFIPSTHLFYFQNHYNKGFVYNIRGTESYNALRQVRSS